MSNDTSLESESKPSVKGTKLEVDQETGEVRPFVSWLAEQRQGLTEVELGDALAELTRAVVETGKKGTLTLKVTVKASGDDMVIVGDEITVKAPKADRAISIFFTDETARLQREDPRQGKLNLREVEKPKNITEIVR